MKKVVGRSFLLTILSLFLSLISVAPAKAFLIVSMGDSFGSGEGNPHQPQKIEFGVPTAGPIWDDKACHRSQLAGAKQAAELIQKWLGEHADRVDFISVACTGAWITHLYRDHYTTPTPEGPHVVLDTQINQVKQLVGSRQIDALFISAGGNDARFGESTNIRIVH